MMAPSTCGFSGCQAIVVGLGDGDEVAAEKHAGDARAARTARSPSGLRAADIGAGEIGGAGAHHIAAGQELQGGGVGCAFGLDEHLLTQFCREPVREVAESGPHRSPLAGLDRRNWEK